MRRGKLPTRLTAVFAAAATMLAVIGGSHQQPAAASSSTGGTLTIASAIDAVPQYVLTFRAANLAWSKQVFEPLVEYDAAGETVPVLATDWTVDEGNGTVVLTIREDVAYHDGRELTADDVVATLELAADPANGSQLTEVAQASTFAATGSHEVTIESTKAVASVFDLLELTPIVDPETFGQIADGVVNGTGPFVWEEWVAGASISLAKNPDYWDPARPHFDAVQINVLSDATALQSAVQSGAADVATGLPLRDALQIAENDAFETITSFQGVVYPLGLNVDEPPFDNQLARQAVGYAIDRERIIEQVFVGEGQPTDLWWTPDDDYPSDLAGHYTYDPDKAAELVAEAGVEGAEVSIAYLSNLAEMKSLYEVIANNLRAVGFEVVENGMPAAEYGERQNDGTLGQAFLLVHGQIGWSAPTMFDAMPSIADGNPSEFSTPEYDELRADVLDATDEERPEALAALSEYMLDQAFSHVIAVAPWLYVVSADVDGLQTSPLGHIIAGDASRTG